jgi:hypothetical protein
VWRRGRGGHARDVRAGSVHRKLNTQLTPKRLGLPPVNQSTAVNGALNSERTPDRHQHEFGPYFTPYQLPSPFLSLSPLAPQDFKTSMPVHRHPSIVRSHAPEPYKTSIIVISSDEDEDPLPPPKRSSRRPRRSRPEGEVLEILDDTSAKQEEPETESLRRRCHELEQACSPFYSMSPQ